MYFLDGKRYKTLNKEFVDLVLGKYGKIPGKITSSLLKKVEKFKQDDDIRPVCPCKTKFELNSLHFVMRLALKLIFQNRILTY